MPARGGDARLAGISLDRAMDGTSNRMDLKTLQDTPPWDWPRDAAKKFQEILVDHQANETGRLIAAELAGDLTVINDELADALTAIIRRPDEPEQLRWLGEKGPQTPAPFPPDLLSPLGLPGYF
jgi:hypothetical protein